MLHLERDRAANERQYDVLIDFPITAREQPRYGAGFAGAEPFPELAVFWRGRSGIALRAGPIVRNGCHRGTPHRSRRLGGVPNGILCGFKSEGSIRDNDERQSAAPKHNVAMAIEAWLVRPCGSSV